MEHVVDNPSRISRTKSQTKTDVSSPAYQAYQILHVFLVWR